MEHHTVQVTRSAVAEPADDIRMAYAIESDGFVLKIFDERSFEIGVEVVLQKNVQSLDNDRAMRRLPRKGVVGREDLGIAAAAKTLFNVVSSVKPAIFKGQFTHLSISIRYYKCKVRESTSLDLRFANAEARASARAQSGRIHPAATVQKPARQQV
jgi:hypothetical protein